WFPWVQLDPNTFRTDEARLVAGFVAAIGLFVSVLLHELGHAVVAKRQGIGVKQITLWLFGGLAMLEGITRDPKAEAKIAIAGPIVSLALGAMPAAFLFVNPGAAVTLIIVYLAGLNVVLAVFNMLPAFPLDGGRLLRAFLAMRMPFGKATNMAADIGKALAVLLGLVGILTNIWLVLIAFFIYMGASQEAQGVELYDALDRISVAEIMDRNVPTVSPSMHMDELIPLMLGTQHTGFPVVVGQSVVGMVTLTDLQEVPEAERAFTRVADIMHEGATSVSPQARASEAMRVMMEEEIGRLLVVDGTKLEGVVTRAGVMQAFKILQQVPKVEVEELAPADLDHLDDEGSAHLR
ncbi:MAG: site-2 protease family protein, partial [Candidatus Thermoplasmatota archaeon]|nr:site-2 protease family protein [Candidatus Thermoplasmatota archaeon]